MFKVHKFKIKKGFCKLGLTLYPGLCFICVCNCIFWLYDLGSIPFLPGPEIKFIHPTDFDEKVSTVYMYNAYA